MRDRVSGAGYCASGAREMLFGEAMQQRLSCRIMPELSEFGYTPYLRPEST
jgi:hypothetical protein